MKLKNMKYPVIIAPTHIPELNSIAHTDRGVRFGASVTLTSIDEELKGAVKEYPGKILFLSFQTDRSGETVQTQIRLLLMEQSDQGLHCLQLHTPTEG